MGRVPQNAIRGPWAAVCSGWGRAMRAASLAATGAGKSVLLALMALQFRRYVRSQVFAFDFGGSIRAAALAMGGDWHDLGGALSEDVAEPVALQPLARIDDGGERAWAADWIAALLARELVPITPELKERLWSALTSLSSAPSAERTITGLSVLLQSNALKQALQPYTVAGPWPACRLPLARRPGSRPRSPMTTRRVEPHSSLIRRSR